MFKEIALGGGGVRGGLQVGALQALEEHKGDLLFPNGIYGCSVGSILATAIAFGLKASQIKEMMNTFKIEEVIPPIRLTTLTEFGKKKGLFSMDPLETFIVDAFKKYDINLTSKTIGDAPQKLSIVACNLTTNKTSFLTGDIPILSAIKASCCLPMVFYPQIIHNNVYVDGGVNLDCICEIVPNDCLVLHIGSPPTPLFPAELESISILSMMGHIYRNMRKIGLPKNVCWLKDYEKSSIDTLTDEDKKRLFETGYSQASRFFAKCLTQEPYDILGGC
jgi:NTE family protein